jgi:hypothetical protein
VQEALKHALVSKPIPIEWDELAEELAQAAVQNNEENIMGTNLQ